MKSVILKDYPELTGIDTKIYLVDGGKELLKLTSAKSQQYTFDQLAKLGVTIKLGINVKDYIYNKVYLDDQKSLMGYLKKFMAKAKE